MQVIERPEPYDAVIVGSGATGGWAAKQLSEAGMRVAVIEAGPRIPPSDFSEHVQPWQLKYRGKSPEIARNRPIQSMKYACRESNYHWFVDDIENPYTHDEDKPFQWTRCRIVGGRSMTWARQSYRFSDLEFKAASRDGYGKDWPVSYEEMAPYYARVERYVGISGQAEGLMQLPDGDFLPPMDMTCGEKHFEQKVESALGRAVTIGRTAIVTREHNGRQPCHYCGPCEQGCITQSYFASPWTTLKDAEATGRATVIPNAVASRIVIDRNSGLVSGAAYIDRLTRTPREIRGKVVILAASTLESTRLMLNSGEGFANSSGVLGHYVMDHLSGSTVGELPLGKSRVWAGPPRRPNGLYIPRFFNVDRARTDGLIRGYGYQAGSRAVSSSALWRMPGFGKEFKERLRQGNWVFSLGSSCECLPRYENYVEIDKDLKDAWGIPALRMHVTWSENDLALRRHAAQSAEEMLHAAGAKDIQSFLPDQWPGGKTHEVGSARMGDDPKSSVLNRWNQSHDIKNLFVTDGSAFVTVAHQNPTLTMMALTVRATDYLIEQFKRGELG